MKYFLRFVFVVIACFLGGLLNYAIVIFGYAIIPPPAGFDMSTEAGFAAALQHFEPAHFIMPFLAHTIGTLVSAYIATKMLGTASAWILPSALFLVGGAMMIAEYPGPMWFNILDLALAYFPAGYVGYRMSGGQQWKLMQSLDRISNG